MVTICCLQVVAVSRSNLVEYDVNSAVITRWNEMELTTFYNRIMSGQVYYRKEYFLMRIAESDARLNRTRRPPAEGTAQIPNRRFGIRRWIEARLLRPRSTDRPTEQNNARRATNQHTVHNIHPTTNQTGLRVSAPVGTSWMCWG